MKICHIITRMIVGGAQENTLYTCRGHLDKGHDVTLITGPSPGPEGKLLERSCPTGLKVVVVPELQREISLRKDWIAYCILKKLLREGHYDVVHTHASKAGILGRLAAWSVKVPFIVHTVHGNAFGPNFSLLKNCLYIRAEHWAARHCHKIYTVAQAMIDQCVQAGIAPKEKYQVVYSGMDLQAFTDAKPDHVLRQQLGIPAEAPVVGAIARLFPLKGHDVLIQAAADVIKNIPETRFLLIGDGILREQLEQKTQQLGIRDHFIFTGLINPEEVCRYTAIMTIVAHLSLREGLPRAAVQGLAAGKPVIAYPLDGTPEVVLDGKTGFLCPPQKANAVAEKIIWLLQHPVEREQMGRTGQQMVLQKFDWHRMADILEQEYLQHL